VFLEINVHLQTIKPCNDIYLVHWPLDRISGFLWIAIEGQNLGTFLWLPALTGFSGLLCRSIVYYMIWRFSLIRWHNLYSYFTHPFTSKHTKRIDSILCVRKLMVLFLLALSLICHSIGSDRLHLALCALHTGLPYLDLAATHHHL